jgi:hypothetical protein
MAKYKRRPDRTTVYIPGLGIVAGDQVIEGDYDRYVPSILVKLAENPSLPLVVEESSLPLVIAPSSDLSPPPEPESTVPPAGESDLGPRGTEEGDDSGDRASMGIRDQAAAVLSKVSRKQRR